MQWITDNNGNRCSVEYWGSEEEARKALATRGGPMSRAINKRELNWAIQRMSRIIRIWAKLDHADRIFLLSRFRSERPQEFREVAEAKEGDKVR